MKVISNQRATPILVAAALAIFSAQTGGMQVMHIRYPVAGDARAISPTVVSMYRTDPTAEGVNLRWLVVLRGHPGWFLTAQDVAGSGAMQSGDGGHIEADRVVFGDVSLSVLVESGHKEARLILQTPRGTIENRQLVRGTMNVVAIDSIDGPGAPFVVRTAWAEPSIPKDADVIGTLIVGDGWLADFLQCDTHVDSEALRQRLLFSPCNR